MHTAYQKKDALLDSIKTLVIEKLKMLSPHLTYHNLAHTLDVTEQSERIARSEGINDEHQLFLLKVAALYHDTGFLRTYKHHEEMSCLIFHEDTAALDFSEEDNRIVEGLIMATRLPQTPHNLLERVICDADLDYLGRNDFFEIGSSLKTEFLKYGVIQSADEFDILQIKFLTGHQYHTATSRNLRESVKQKNITSLT